MLLMNTITNIIKKILTMCDKLKLTIFWTPGATIGVVPAIEYWRLLQNKKEFARCEIESTHMER